MKSIIFISYIRKDREAVLPFVQSIEEFLGERCWMDIDGIESGAQFEDVIIRAIDSSRIVLLMLSENALGSDFVKKEVKYAKSRKKRIVPVVLDRKALRGWFLFNFGDLDYIDIYNKSQCQKLRDNLAKWCLRPDVFICHSIHDNHVVTKLRDLFDGNSISFYDDKLAVTDGIENDCDTLLKRNIFNAKVFVYLSSEYASSSENVKFELRYAMRCHKGLIILKLDTTPYPEEFEPYMRSFPKIDTTYYNQSVEKELVERIKIEKNG